MVPDHSIESSFLYITYDGLLEPLGESQVLTYQERLARHGSFHLLSFEKVEGCADGQHLADIAQRLNDAGITWHMCRYHKRPAALATVYDILVGLAFSMHIVIRNHIKIVHTRSYVPAVIGLILKKLCGIKFIFDMRGFWADERVDGGLWPRDSKLYRLAKWFERQFLLNADHVVSLTHAAVREIERFPYLVDRMPRLTVIPTCADLVRFCPQPVASREFIFGYVGSAGTWYEFDATVACFAEILRFIPESKFLIINRQEHEYILERLVEGGIPLAKVELCCVDYQEMPSQMARMCAAIFFIKPVFSKLASAPTKLAELLGCGIPCLTNIGVGDMAEILEGEQVGVAVNGFSPDALQLGLERLLQLMATDEINERCVKAAHRHFSLGEGVEKYNAIYQSLMADLEGKP